MAGAGYAAHLHGNGYKNIGRIPIRLKTICDLDLSRAKAVQQHYGFENASTQYQELLDDPEIDVIDIVTPPVFHPEMAVAALKAGKHVICEKPLTGYFGEPGETEIGNTVPKSHMYKKVLASMEDLKHTIASTDRKFFYAENYVYATPIQKAAELIRAKKGKLLFLKGEESVKGSTSPLAGQWNGTGGGSLIRLGCHPLTGILWLKQQEAQARGEKITIQSVIADTGRVTACLTDEEHRYIAAHPIDVEDVGSISITYSDGTKALIIASDVVLGGTKNYIELYSNDSVLLCQLTPTNLLQTYFRDEQGIDDFDLAEMLPSKIGWNHAFVSDEIIRGYTGELQDFIESIAYNRDPLSDFQLAYETIKVLYAAYQSAEEGRRISF